MIFRFLTPCCLVAVMFLAGCVGAPKPDGVKPEPVVSAPVASKPSEERSAQDKPRVVAPTPSVPGPTYKKRGATPVPRESVAEDASDVLGPGEFKVKVESEPTGATVVMNGKPCGRTPCAVIVQANARGFLRELVTIKVRFVATSEAEESQTVEDVLTTFDKVPAEIRFTTAGARRVLR
jgi:hypothetical protein